LHEVLRFFLNICARPIGSLHSFNVVAFGGQTTNSSYKHLPLMGGIFPQIATATEGEPTDRIQKVGGVKNGTDLLYYREFWWGSYVER